MAIDGTQKKRGRPLTGVTPRIALRFPTELTARIDAFAERDKLTRSEAVRRLIERGLKG
jgi:metal-responsive CopG/Arc/MetJ family transcriptional regulator